MKKEIRVIFLGALALFNATFCMQHKAFKKEQKYHRAQKKQYVKNFLKKEDRQKLYNYKALWNKHRNSAFARKIQGNALMALSLASLGFSLYRFGDKLFDIYDLLSYGDGNTITANSLYATSFLSFAIASCFSFRVGLKEKDYYSYLERLAQKELKKIKTRFDQQLITREKK